MTVLPRARLGEALGKTAGAQPKASTCELRAFHARNAMNAQRARPPTNQSHDGYDFGCAMKNFITSSPQLKLQVSLQPNEMA